MYMRPPRDAGRLEAGIGIGLNRIAHGHSFDGGGIVRVIGARRGDELGFCMGATYSLGSGVSTC